MLDELAAAASPATVIGAAAAFAGAYLGQRANLRGAARAGRRAALELLDAIRCPKLKASALALEELERPAVHPEP